MLEAARRQASAAEKTQAEAREFAQRQQAEAERINWERAAAASARAVIADVARRTVAAEQFALDGEVENAADRAWEVKRAAAAHSADRYLDASDVVALDGFRRRADELLEEARRRHRRRLDAWLDGKRTEAQREQDRIRAEAEMVQNGASNMPIALHKELDPRSSGFLVRAEALERELSAAREQFAMVGDAFTDVTPAAVNIAKQAASARRQTTTGRAAVLSLVSGLAPVLSFVFLVDSCFGSGLTSSDPEAKIRVGWLALSLTLSLAGMVGIGLARRGPRRRGTDHGDHVVVQRSVAMRWLVGLAAGSSAPGGSPPSRTTWFAADAISASQPTGTRPSSDLQRPARSAGSWKIDRAGFVSTSTLKRQAG